MLVGELCVVTVWPMSLFKKLNTLHSRSHVNFTLEEHVPKLHEANRNKFLVLYLLAQSVSFSLGLHGLPSS